MAKLQYFAAIPDNSNWSTPFVKSFKMDVHSGTFAELIPAAGGENISVTFRGIGFVYNAAGDFIEGTVRSVTFTSGNDDLIKLSGLNLSAADALTSAEDSPAILFIEHLQGHDRVIGSNEADRMVGLSGDDFMFGKGGNDTLDGGFGQNTLTGGKGADIFTCAATDGDTIIDFDAHGGMGKQDLIDINGLDFTLAKSGKNTLVGFVGGDILLIGIKPTEIDSSDFTAI
jgi:Ca2+-binding RTX toxin-like protein